MNTLKRVTLFAGCCAILATLSNSYGYIKFLGEASWERNAATLITWPIGILFQVSLAIFFFVLGSRQKGN